MFKKPSFLMGFGEKTSYNYPFSWGGGWFKMFKKPSFLMGFGEKTSYNYPFSWGGGSKCSKNLHFSWVLVKKQVITTHFLGGVVQNVQKTFISHGFW